MTTLAHVSDLHIWRYEPIPVRSFANKRLVGGANIAFNRNKKHSPEVVANALALINELDVDHVAVSGDLTNLAMWSEFRAASEMVGTLDRAPEDVSIIPGNHDYYTADAQNERRFETTFDAFMTSQFPQHQGASGYPYVKYIGDHVALISLNSGIVSPPMFAIGRVRKDELARLENILDEPDVQRRTIVVQVHHHLLPFEHSRFEAMRRLINAPTLLKLLRLKGVRLALHGHNHCSQIDTLPHLIGDGSLVIAGCSSTSVISHPTRVESGGSFNLYTFDDGLRRIDTFMHDPADGQFTLWRTQNFPT